MNRLQCCRVTAVLAGLVLGEDGVLCPTGWELVLVLVAIVSYWVGYGVFGSQTFSLVLYVALTLSIYSLAAYARKRRREVI